MKQAKTIFILALWLAMGSGFSVNIGFSQHFLHNNLVQSKSSTPKQQVISFDEAAQLYNSKEAIFIDARNHNDYILGHIPGALNLSEDQQKNIKSMYHFLPDNLTIVVYCNTQNCTFSDKMAKALANAGMKNIKVFPNAWTQWNSKKMPVETVKP